jgi:hypothetical protein
MLDRRDLARFHIADRNFRLRLFSLQVGRRFNRNFLRVAVCARCAVDRDLIAGAPVFGLLIGDPPPSPSA